MTNQYPSWKAAPACQGDDNPEKWQFSKVINKGTSRDSWIEIDVHLGLNRSGWEIGPDEGVTSAWHLNWLCLEEHLLPPGQSGGSLRSNPSLGVSTNAPGDETPEKGWGNGPICFSVPPISSTCWIIRSWTPAFPAHWKEFQIRAVRMWDFPQAPAVGPAGFMQLIRMPQHLPVEPCWAHTGRRTPAGGINITPVWAWGHFPRLGSAIVVSKLW